MTTVTSSSPKKVEEEKKEEEKKETRGFFCRGRFIRLQLYAALFIFAFGISAEVTNRAFAPRWEVEPLLNPLSVGLMLLAFYAVLTAFAAMRYTGPGQSLLGYRLLLEPVLAAAMGAMAVEWRQMGVEKFPYAMRAFEMRGYDERLLAGLWGSLVFAEIFYVLAGVLSFFLPH